MKLWITQDSVQQVTVGEQQQFFGIPIELPDSKARPLLEFQQKWKEYQKYMRTIQAVLATNNPTADVNTVEVPKWLEEVPSEEPRKKRATAPRSSKKSPAKRKKNASSASTSQKTDE